jgi:cytochrome c oxidase subunit 1
VSESLASRFARSAWIACVALAVSGFVLAITGMIPHDIDEAALGLALLGCATVGALLAARIPGNAVGWILLTIALVAIVGTLIGGAILLTTAMWFVVGFLLLFLLGGLSGIFIASPTLDYHVTDTYFIVAHFHYTLIGGSLMGLFAGIYYWFPKATGALLREGLGKLHFVLIFVGSLVTFLPQFVLGEEGMRRRIADYPAKWETLNMVSSIGSYVIALSILVFLVNVFVSLRRRVPAGNDPWGAQTLEWWTTSPPPRLNFGSLPPVRSFAPLLDLREERGEA